MDADLTIQGLAELTGLHAETLRRQARKGNLPGVYRIGRRWMISRAAVNRLRNVPTDERGTRRTP